MTLCLAVNCWLFLWIEHDELFSLTLASNYGYALPASLALFHIDFGLKQTLIYYISLETAWHTGYQLWNQIKWRIQNSALFCISPHNTIAHVTESHHVSRISWLSHKNMTIFTQVCNWKYQHIWSWNSGVIFENLL